MKKRAFTIWEFIVVVVFLAIAAAILMPIYGPRPRQYDGNGPSCQSRLKNIGLGLLQYTQDYNEKFPLVNSGQQGWVELIQPYIKDVSIFQCPSDKKGKVEGTTDYFYNARLAGQPIAKLKSAAETLSLGDGLGNSPFNATLTQFPASWVSNVKSPAYRHLEGANYGYADGHVKWLKPSSVGKAKAGSTKSTFALW